VAGRDETTIQHHVDKMKAEMKKRDPNRALIGDAMKRTVAFRQNFCHEHSTSAVLEEFPALKLRLFVSFT
jgi:hypothetical protein